MSEKDSKRYMELQMEEMQETFGVEKEAKKKEDMSGRPEDLEIATLYEDAWEYEEELELFEQELTLIKENATHEIEAAFEEHFDNEDRNYGQELKAVIESVCEDEAQLEVIRQTPFGELASTLIEKFPSHEGNFETELKSILVNRWNIYIEVKKEHIKEETSYIKTLGLKPHYAKRIYKRYHGIE